MFVSSVEEEQREGGLVGMGSKNVVASTPNSAPHRLGNKSGNNRSGSIPTMPMWRKKSVPIIENEAENESSECDSPVITTPGGKSVH